MATNEGGLIDLGGFGSTLGAAAGYYFGGVPGASFGARLGNTVDKTDEKIPVQRTGDNISAAAGGGDLSGILGQIGLGGGSTASDIAANIPAGASAPASDASGGGFFDTIGGYFTPGNIAAAGSALATADEVYRRFNEQRRQSEAKDYEREFRGRIDDTDLRREATYRNNMQIVNNALSEIYKKRGWAFPTNPLPGAYTSRALPGETPLYSEYDVPRSKIYYPELLPEFKLAKEAQAMADMSASVPPLSQEQELRTMLEDTASMGKRREPNQIEALAIDGAKYAPQATDLVKFAKGADTSPDTVSNDTISKESVDSGGSGASPTNTKIDPRSLLTKQGRLNTAIDILIGVPGAGKAISKIPKVGSEVGRIGKKLGF